ncbi:MAG: NAD(P)/FAD-dependent oxidoreductase [Rhodospirillaceae bacterium]|jgi:glutathione reductase (NADPH)|nr:NAD(P)/FAD-dependent oxidoreductase [Rhodospirillaceae bacterium]MBT5047779.1 NAD(P)/FAD-dependent oxidoreductase [Rhodospirillaceae bacterium]MBT5459721.1 NAD(P)/FAD-dependent oxidoreductase [Rhodospirillaceae bacterium]
MSTHFDVLVLGTGNAGMAAAGAARAAGKEVAMVESRDVGGTCPIRGCVPKKVLVAAAQVLDQIERAPAHHIDVGKPVLDWPKLIARKETFVAGVPDDFKKSLDGRGITLIDGRARFTGANEVTVGDQSYSADRIVIATGSVARSLPIPGWEHTITSDDILDMAEQPESLVFIGGGVIAMEFSHVLARAGTKVTILEALPRLLPRLEGDAVAVLQAETERLGVEIITDVNVDEIKPAKGGFTVLFEKDGKTVERTATLIANGTGRVADVDGLDLDAGEIAHDKGRIAVTDHLRSISNPGIYVAGDALWSTAQLSPVASYEGRIVGRNLIEEDSAVPDYTDFPSAVYTVPALASVGLTEAEATEKGLKFKAKSNDMTTWRSARTYAETASFAKVLVEDGTGKILGAHMLGHGAEEVIHLFSLAIAHGITAAEMAGRVYAYPTFTSDLKFLV